MEAEASHYLASWGGRNTVDQVRELTQHIDALAARIERAIAPTGEEGEVGEMAMQAG